MFLAVCAAGILALGRTLNYERYSGDVKEELMYFPSGRLLEVASAGYETLAADLLWLKGIQYYGEHRRGDKEYHLAEHIFATITDLDPHFAGAYRFGAFVLAQDAGQPVAGAELLKKGMRYNPDLWQMPFDLGFLYFIAMKDNAKAARYFEIASRHDAAPDIARRFMAFAYRKAGRPEIALSLWTEIYESSSNRLMRETALYSIRNIRLETTADTLTSIADAFSEAVGRYPEDLDELVSAGYVAGIPQDPFGGHYFLDHEARRVVSTTSVGRETEHYEAYLQRYLDQYSDRKGRYPSELADLVEEGLITEIPIVPGADLRYDPSEGRVDYIVRWKEHE
jgi:tetratricopeptide (TPR) repeat protein